MKINYRRWLILIAFSLPQLVMALSCVKPDKPRLYEKADWVGKARVLEVERIQNNVDGLGGQAVNVHVEVKQLHKGAPKHSSVSSNGRHYQRVVFSHVPQIGSDYTLFVQYEDSPSWLNKTLRLFNPDWADPDQIAGRSCYRGDFLIDPANTDQFSTGGSVRLSVYAPWPSQRMKDALQTLRLFLQPLDTPNAALIALASPANAGTYFSADKLPAGKYQLVARLPNAKLGLGGYWFYDVDAPLKQKIFYQLAAKNEGDKLCELSPPVTLVVTNLRGTVANFRVDTVPNESLDDSVSVNSNNKGNCK